MLLDLDMGLVAENAYVTFRFRQENTNCRLEQWDIKVIS